MLPLLGYGWAHWDRALALWRPGPMLVVVLAWVLLQAGTLWLNAHRDQDTGEVLLGRSVPVPEGTDRLGLAALAGCAALAWLADPLAGGAAAACAALAILYSHPRTSWKAHPVLGPLTNVLGYGVLSPLAGYAIVGTPPTPRTLVIAALLAVTVLGWTFAAQSFQAEEDRRRGDRTLVATHGPVVTLLAARSCFAVATVGLGVLVAIGWLPVLTGLALPALLASDAWLAWWTRHTDHGERRARVLIALGAVAVVLALVGTATAYVQQALGDGPVAGLATRSGRPGDRPRLPASQLTRLDHAARVRTGSVYHARREPPA